jgi:hypothetical protein
MLLSESCTRHPSNLACPMLPTASDESFKFSSPHGWQIGRKVITDELPFGLHDRISARGNHPGSLSTDGMSLPSRRQDQENRRISTCSPSFSKTLSRVYAHGADSAPVGAEYIMYDKIGVPLQLFDPSREVNIKVKHIPLGYKHAKNIATKVKDLRFNQQEITK